MSKVLLIYCHPNPKSFNHAICERLEKELKANGAEIRTRDLYQMKFDPVLDAEDFTAMKSGTTPADILAEQAEVTWADRLAFVYPLWWYDRPTMLKGYIDRVYSYGFAFKYGKAGAIGLLPHKKSMVIMTTGTPEASLAKVKEILPVAMKDGTLKFCGVKEVIWKTFYGVVAATDADRKAMLEEIPALAKQLDS